MVVPKCLLDVNCNSTMAQHSVRFPGSFAASCGLYSGCRRQVLNLRFGGWRHPRVHLHCPASLWLDDQVFVGWLPSTRNHTLAFFHRHSAEIENNMNAVERLLYYADNIDQEREIKENGLVSEKWPQRGEIEFSDVKMSHRPGLPLVLKGVNLKIKDGEHVGIVGRTGAGKSSIIAALFGMTELESGTITIDGVDTSQVSLQKLRDGLSSMFFSSSQLQHFSCYFDSYPTRPAPLQRDNTKQSRSIRGARRRHSIRSPSSSLFGRPCRRGGGNNCVF